VELDEYTGSSQDLERELDQELNQCKQKISRLQTDMAALTEANRGLQVPCVPTKRFVCETEITKDFFPSFLS
jgi:hypothetical protein